MKKTDVFTLDPDEYPLFVVIKIPTAMTQAALEKFDKTIGDLRAHVEKNIGIDVPFLVVREGIEVELFEATILGEDLPVESDEEASELPNPSMCRCRVEDYLIDRTHCPIHSGEDDEQA